jgi:hypothetical protein
MASDLLAKITNEIDARLADLRPLVSEYERLIAALESLREMDGASQSTPAPPSSTTKAPARRGPGRPRGSASGALKAASSPSTPAKRSPRKRTQAPLGPVGQAVLDALEHGSHSVSELVMVTAMAANEIRSSVRLLLNDKRIGKVSRDGKTAYALSSSVKPTSSTPAVSKVSHTDGASSERKATEAQGPTASGTT